MNSVQSLVGHCRAVGSLGPDDANAVLVTVVARKQRRRRRQRLMTTSIAGFTPRVIRHLRRTVLPIVDRLVHLLLPSEAHARYEIALVMSPASSVTWLHPGIGECEVDAAIMLALVSAALDLPLRQDIIVCSHMAPPTGGVPATGGIPARYDHIGSRRDVSLVVRPSVGRDLSNALTVPVNTRPIGTATAAEGDCCYTHDIAALLRAMVDPNAIALCALRSGFFSAAHHLNDDTSLGRAASFLGSNNETRFWSALEEHALCKDVDAVHALVLARLHYHIRLTQYPRGFGRRLFQWVSSLPPAICDTRGLFPLAPLTQCIKVCELAPADDHEDAQLLYRSSEGSLSVPAEQQPSAGEHGTPAQIAWTVLSQICEDTLAQTIGLAVNRARASFILDDIMIDTDDAFMETVTGFYCALLRSLGSHLVSPRDHTTALESLELLERAFANRGGVDAALAEARSGFQGGMSFVLDVMSARYKHERQADHVQRVIAEAVNPLDWGGRVAFVRSLLEALGPLIPAELREQPLERLATHHAELAQACADLLSVVNSRWHVP